MSDKEASKNTSQDKGDTKKTETTKGSADNTADVSTQISFSSSSSTSANKPSSASTDQASKSIEQTNENTSKPTISKKVESNSTAKKPTTSKTSPSKKPLTSPPSKATKVTAIIALVIALISVAASVGHYFWQQQLNNAQLVLLQKQSQQVVKQSQSQLQRTLSAEFNGKLKQQYQANQEAQYSAKLAHENTTEELPQLTEQMTALTTQVAQRDPSDWLIHEAEYLARIAARTMWIERDTTAAIGLLRDADSRLKELNQSKFLPVRALINEDIEALALMPVLTNEEAILTLMALNKQVPNLTLAGVNLAEALDEVDEDFLLSDDLNDWQENLARTWKKFIKDFITVRRRTGMVEPLMSPDQQQHLRQNLSLKIQLTQWAASEQKESIYQQTLLDIQQWLNEFFAMDAPENKRFYSSIESLKKQTIYYDYPSDLRSLNLLKRLLAETKQGKSIKKQVSEPNINQKSTPEAEVVPRDTAIETPHVMPEEISGDTL